jgi:hypothetical protein
VVKHVAREPRAVRIRRSPSRGYDALMAANDPTQPNPEKYPAEWVTGEEPATGPQLSYLGTLAQQAGEKVPDDLTKAQASQLIDELQARTGRGSDSNA